MWGFPDAGALPDAQVPHIPTIAGQAARSWPSLSSHLHEVGMKNVPCGSDGIGAD
jgi:hypothetical protein